MIVVPIAGNAAQFWLTDSILQKKDWSERDRQVLRYYFLSNKEPSELVDAKNEGKLSPMNSHDEHQEAADSQSCQSQSEIDPQVLSEFGDKTNYTSN